MADFATGINLNVANQERLRDEIFRDATASEFMVGQDFQLAERATAQARGNDAYRESAADALQTSIDLARAQVDADHAHEHQEFESRIHLLEVFIVAVYVFEVYHNAKTVGWSGAVVAMLGGALAAAYIFHKQKGRSQVSTLVVCALLIVLPFVASAVGQFFKAQEASNIGDQNQLTPDNAEAEHH